MYKKLALNHKSNTGFVNSMMFLIIGFIISWIALVTINALNIYSDIDINMWVSALRGAINLLILITLLKIYSSASQINRKIYFWLIIAMIGRVFYRTILYLEIYHYNISFSSVFNSQLWSLNFFAYLLYYIPLLFWYIGLIGFLILVLIYNISNKLSIIKNFIITMIFIAPVFVLFFFSFKSQITIFSTAYLFQTLIIVYKFIVFVIFIICVLYANHSIIQILLFGIGIETASGTLTHYSAISNTQNLILLGEIFGLLGFIIIFIGLILLAKYRVSLQGTFKNIDSIKSKISLWTFNFSISGIIIFSVFEYLLGFLNKSFFGELPFFIIMYSIIIVILSIFIGKYFEYPFKQFATNLNLMMSGKHKNKIENKFIIEEFVLLHKHMLNLFNIKEEKDKLEKKFGEIAVKAAHDLGSPLTSINAEIHNIKNNDLNNINYPILESSLNRIKEITNNILVQYRELTNNKLTKTINEHFHTADRSNEPRYINIVNLIGELIDSKKSEWQSNPCNISLVSALNYPMFLFCPSQLRRIISNLLNNSYESFNKNQGEILVYLKETETELIISIKDNGCGIPSDKVNDILSGKSLKHKGKGLGVSSAVGYVKSLGGTLNIASELNYGTELTMALPFPILPAWLTTSIPYSHDSIFIILDDDASIHVKMQMTFRSRNIKSFHYTDVDSFFNFIHDISAFKKLILFIDLNVNNSNWDGIKIINHLSQGVEKTNIYLMTNDAEDIYVQDDVRMHKIQLVPKNILEYILHSMVLQEEV